MIENTAVKDPRKLPTYTLKTKYLDQKIQYTEDCVGLRIPFK